MINIPALLRMELKEAPKFIEIINVYRRGCSSGYV
jgi:hypothetical protein